MYPFLLKMATYIYKIDVSEETNCNTIKVWCTSGILDINGNTTGYGATPTDISSQIAISLLVTDPNNTTTTFDLFALLSANGFYFLYGVEYFEITPDMLSQTTGVFTDGIYTFYSVVTYLNGNDGVTEYTFTGTKQKYLMCQHECIVNQMWDEATSLVNSCESCSKEKLELASEAQSYLTAAKFAANCNMPNKALAILEKIDNLDEFRNCSNCS